MTTNVSECIDCITGGPTEAILMSHYEEIRKHNAAEYVLINMNIKRFLYINTKHGREKGDEALYHLYTIARSLMHDEEYIARSHADNFYLLLRYHDMDSLLHHFLYPIIDISFDFEHPVFYHNIYLSFGFFFLKDRDCDYETAKDMASMIRKECEQIKRRTFSYEYYRPHLYDKFMTRNEMADKVTQARFDNAFVPYVQPKIDLATKKIVGGEILLRWFDKQGNEIPLSTFLPVLNAHGDIYLVDLNIFEKVCAYLETCIREHRNVVPVSFNVTNTSLFDEEFLKDYLSILKKYQVPENYIEFEFMENIQFDRYNKVKEIIDIFHKHGFTCSLDDFGSGYSSFNILLEQKIDVLKIDRMFFNCPMDETRRSIIYHIIEIAHCLGVKVLAEGVENEETLNLLEECNCDMVQGYYFYKPMPLPEFEKLLDEQAKHNETGCS